MKTEAFTKIQNLQRTAKSLRGFRERYTALKTDSRNDKMGEGFNLDSRFKSFAASLSFDTWIGTYGNSDCTTILNVDDAIGREYLIKAVNQHRDKILQTMANLMDADAKNLVQEAKLEVAEMTAKLDELEQSA